MRVTDGQAQRTTSTEPKARPRQRKAKRPYDPRSLAKPGEGLREVHPVLAAQALECVQYPQLDPGRMKPHSSLDVRWRCQCGVPVVRRVCNVTRAGRALCDGCRLVGRSRFEYEVAELLRVMLDTDVATHVGATRKDEVDLHLLAYGMAVELDPFYTHRGKVHSDSVRLAQHRVNYGRAVRVREEGLPLIEGCPTVVPKARSYVWAQAVAAYTSPGQWRHLNEATEREALRRANQAWDALLTTPPIPSVADTPRLAQEFVEDLTHPGRSARWLSLGAADICLWRCRTCGHQWSQGVDKRGGPQKVGCPPCGAQRSGAATRAAQPGKAVADRAPLLVAEFVSNKTSGLDLSQTRPHSRDLCVWRCSYCSATWRATIKNRYQSHHRGCEKCNGTKAWEQRRLRKDGHDAAYRQSALQKLAEFVQREGHARVPEGFVSRDGFTLYAWVHTQRKKKRNLCPAQVADLEAIPGWTWAPRQDEWEAGFASLLRYVEVHHDALIPAIYLDGSGYSLGLFVQKQRQRFAKGHLSPERVNRLEGVPGWRWRLRVPRGTAMTAQPS